MKHHRTLLTGMLAFAPLCVVGNYCEKGSDTEKTSQKGCRTNLWDVQPLNYTDESYGGYPQLNVSSRTVYHKGADVNRTYSHHPMVLNVGPTVILAHSSGKVDEDAMGMTVWGGVSHDGGYTWTKSQEWIPKPLLSNQTDEHNFTYWCSEGIPQRTIAPEAIVRSPNTGLVYVVGATRNFYCNDKKDVNKYPRSAGRIARPLNLTSGEAIGEPCWTIINDYTYDLGFDKVYGSEYCFEADTINEIFGGPLGGPSWARIYNFGELRIADGVGSVEEPTLGLWDMARGVYQRFWRDTSSETAIPYILTECNCNSSNWYPNDLAPDDNDQPLDVIRPIYPTDIPDQRTKQWFSTFATSEYPSVRYLVHNPRDNKEKVRYPLTLSWQGLKDAEADWSFKNIGVLDTNPPGDIAPDSRKLKRKMFSYPNAVQVDDHLVVAYSQNKEDIVVSVVDLEALA